MKRTTAPSHICHFQIFTCLVCDNSLICRFNWWTGLGRLERPRAVSRPAHPHFDCDVYVCLTDTDCTLTATLMSTRAIFARASLIALHTRLVYLCSSHSPWLSGALLTSCESHSQADFHSAPVFRQRRIQVDFSVTSVTWGPHDPLTIVVTLQYHYIIYFRLPVPS